MVWRAFSCDIRSLNNAPPQRIISRFDKSVRVGGQKSTGDLHRLWPQILSGAHQLTRQVLTSM